MSSDEQPDGKVERDPAEETGEQGVPASDPEPASAAPDEPSGPARPQPPAMTPLQVAANPTAMFRVHCDARHGAERCLYASNGAPPVDEAGEPFADPQAACMAAAGCLDDPPACPCVVGDTTAVSPDSRDAVTAVARTLDASIAAALPAGIGAEVIHPLRARRHPSTVAGGLDVGGELAAATVGGPSPLVLTTAEAHGITDSARPTAPTVLASGQDVSQVLRMLAVDMSAAEVAVVQRPDTPPPADDAGDAADDHAEERVTEADT